MNHLPMNVRVPIEKDNPSICRDEALCIKCGQCRDVCTDYIGVHGTYTLEQTGGTAVCINCGQCANVCPVSSITEKYEYRDVREAVRDPEKIVIFNTSPSVRIALGEEFDMEDGSFVQGKMVALLRKLGASYVLDTNFAADLTIMEEASELIERITKKEQAAAAVYELLSFLGQVCGDLSSGHAAASVHCKESDWNAGADRKDVFCKEDGAKS